MRRSKSILLCAALAPWLCAAAAASAAAPATAELAYADSQAAAGLKHSLSALEQAIGRAGDRRRALESELGTAERDYRSAIARARTLLGRRGKASGAATLAAWQAARRQLATIVVLEDRVRALALRLGESASDARALAAMAAAVRTLSQTGPARATADAAARQAGRLGRAAERTLAALDRDARRWRAVIGATTATLERLADAAGTGLPPGVM